VAGNYIRLQSGLLIVWGLYFSDATLSGYFLALNYLGGCLVPGGVRSQILKLAIMKISKFGDSMGPFRKRSERRLRNLWPV
jgi:hypothetical protein